MGLLDGILGQVASAALGGKTPAGGPADNPLGAILAGLAGGNGGQSSQLMKVAMSVLQQQGGLPGLLKQFGAAGLQQQADSWVSTGANQAITGDQLTKALGSGALGQIASQLGMHPGQASGALAQLLPELVNQLTPNGKVGDDHADLVSKGLEMLKGLQR
jgi:uncharacterized protein YidB (DUF937 family)